MIEKVNPMHPDKIADRIAGAITDLAYSKMENPKIATEVLIGHGDCNIIVESNIKFLISEIINIVERIAGENITVNFRQEDQDVFLSNNQSNQIKCGDNGIFKGMPLTEEQKEISQIARNIYQQFPTDGKYILSNKNLIICQSNAKTEELKKIYPNAKVNPLGD